MLNQVYKVEPQLDLDSNNLPTSASFGNSKT